MHYQYGFSAKGVIEFQKGIPVIRLAANAGIGAVLFNYLFPSYNLEVQFYYNGSGTRAFKNNKRWQPTIDLVNAFTLTGSWQQVLRANRLSLQIDRNIPLYYFADFTIPALQNPFNNSISLGTNIVINSNVKERKYIQRVGFINFHFQRFQFSYYNDGGYGINQLCLGDGHDRGYTGGGVISYHLPTVYNVNLMELSYHKFTGTNKNAFELSNQADLASVDYLNPLQQLYNKSDYSFTLANTAKNYGAFVKLNNDLFIDFQQFIHYNLFYSYHLTPYPTSFGFGLDGIYNNSHIYTK